MAFEVNEIFSGVMHIRDAMGVCMTLLAGTKRALLVDTGYGMENVHDFVRSLTDKPLTVVLTHSHHDHAMGARWFDQVYLMNADIAAYGEFTGPKLRARVTNQAKYKGLDADESLMTAEFPAPTLLEECVIDLGGMTAQILSCPGHTPGSAVVYIPEYQLLLTGDDWNPCTWLFFEAALGAKEYRHNVQQLLKLPFTQVLCSHQLDLYPREKLERFLLGLTDDALRCAKKVVIPPYAHIDTRQVDLPEEQVFVFDYAKAGMD